MGRAAGLHIHVQYILTEC